MHLDDPYVLQSVLTSKGLFLCLNCNMTKHTPKKAICVSVLHSRKHSSGIWDGLGAMKLAFLNDSMERELHICVEPPYVFFYIYIKCVADVKWLDSHFL